MRNKKINFQLSTLTFVSGGLLIYGKARIILLVDLREKNFRFRVWGGREKKKALKMTSGSFSELFLLLHFQSFFSFLISPEKNSNTSKVNQQSLYISSFS